MSSEKGENYLQHITFSNSAYSLILRNRTPLIKPGDTVEVEVFYLATGFLQKINWTLSGHHLM